MNLFECGANRSKSIVGLCSLDTRLSYFRKTHGISQRSSQRITRSKVLTIGGFER